MSFQFPKPDNHVAFELFCLRFLGELWKCSTLVRYGKSGEEQHGIDIIDQSAQTPWRAAQCKHHESHKSLPDSEIEDEVNKVIAGPHKIHEYHILTTAKKTTRSQDVVFRLNQSHKQVGLFTIHLWTWDEIEEKV